MKFRNVVAIAIIFGTASISALQAQSFRDQPKEFPPASYKGKQYVDSTGCVFIRAGIDGNVTWVPRVTRKRVGVCGFKPTNAGTALASSAPLNAGAVQITLNTPPAQTAPVAVKPRPVPKIRRTAPVVRQTAPKVVRQTAQRPVVAVPAAAQAAPVCSERSPIAQRYMAGARMAVRCGPQTARIEANPVGGTHMTPKRKMPAGTVMVSPNTRIVPKHVAVNRINTYNTVQVPKGYRSVWEDDRLNPKRTEQTLAGRAQMNLMWTNTVPRRLVNQTTGQDVTAKMPLVYPYTSIDQQRLEMGKVTLSTRNGVTVKRIVRNRGVSSTVRRPTYSSRSAAKADTAAVAPIRNGGSTYVQVGVFQNAGNAQRTAQRIAGMGMVARIGKSVRGGKTYLSVQAGPFAKASAPHALGKLRGSGYGDAYIR
ncbi:Sporulation related domain-containing protein [Sulfitobacter marinus]|uniref:Sporulation related domain-containing protein n=1 Tax=Sulfitobacter marinus TaxID=394264 RepID=A0A1I6RN49_9RHOB|nr:SPOR domain-containing protein [Sulfitobacter marinus]SFS66066.1 Sporulation related domain-containing protein [Sulfitobacter marinus]